jgi:flagellar hook protein FlgE
LYQGRLEIYVLGQGKKSHKPVYVGPLPFAEVDGRPLSHIVPLIFNHEPEYPLRGMAHADRILPQIQELNSYRSFMAMATRKDTRQYITRKGTFGADEMTDLTEGHDGLILQLEQDYDRPLGDAIVPLGNTPISSNIDQYMALVENDLDRNLSISPSARGIVTKATAFEVQAVQQYTESEFGMHASIKDEWLTSVLKVVLRALISSMQDLGDSAGAYDDQSVQLAEVGAIANEQQQELQVEGQEQDGATGQEQLAAAQEQEEDAEQQPFVSEDSIEGYEQDSKEEGKIEPDVLVLRDRREFIDVSTEDLDADFGVTFLEGGGAPMDEAVQQQNLLGLLEPYTALWNTAQQGGPMGFMARTYMKTMAEKFNLPKDLHPDELDSKFAEEGEQQEAPQQAAQQTEEQGAPPPAETALSGQAPPDLSDLAQLPPQEAIVAMRDIFAEDAEMQQVLDQLETLPPDQQAQMIAQMLTPGEAGATV